MEKAIPRRALGAALGTLLAETGGKEAQEALLMQFDAASCVSDLLNVAKAFNGTDAPCRMSVMENLRAECSPHVAAYGGYLQVVASSPHPEVFEDLAREEASPSFRLEHPGHSRSLYGAMAGNNAQLWTEQGLVWAEETVVKLAGVNENVALGVLTAFQLVDLMDEPLRGRVRELLKSLSERIDAAAAPSLQGRILEMFFRKSELQKKT